MWSPNSAASAGAKLARYIDVQASNADLVAAIDREITPGFRPRRTVGHGRFENAQRLAAVAFVGLIGGLSLAAFGLLPASTFASGPLSALQNFRGQVDSFTPLFIAVAIVMVLTFCAAIFWLVRTRRDLRDVREYQISQLRQAAYQEARRVLDRRRGRPTVPASSAPRSVESAWVQPAARPDGVTPEGAEHLAAEWMRHLGASSAGVTRHSGDGGIDVASNKYIAQVKHFGGNVGVAPLRELAGVATLDRRSALFFTRTGYAPGAVDFADRAGIALFVYTAETGRLACLNGAAQRIWTAGLED